MGVGSTGDYLSRRNSPGLRNRLDGLRDVRSRAGRCEHTTLTRRQRGRASADATASPLFNSDALIAVTAWRAVRSLSVQASGAEAGIPLFVQDTVEPSELAASPLMFVPCASVDCVPSEPMRTTE